MKFTTTEEGTVSESTTYIDEQSPELHAALGRTISQAFNRSEPLECYAQNTGGGCFVAVVDLSLDARGIGRQLWLTREEDWFLGFYDFSDDPEDEGIVVQLPGSGELNDSVEYVAATVAGILIRLGVDKLQGE